MEIHAKEVFHGQKRRYGDFISEWELKTAEPEENVHKWCLETLTALPLPERSEWSKNIAYGSEHFGDPDYYFRGYYEMRPIEGGYLFEIHQPYAD